MVNQSDKTQEQLLKELAAAQARIVDLEHSFCAAAPVGFYRTDANGKYTQINEKWSEITGLSSDEALGDGWTDSLYPEDKDSVFKEWRLAVSDKRPFEMEYRFQNANNEIIWVAGKAVAELDDEGDVRSYLGTITDISKQRQAEESLRQSESQFRNVIDASPVPYALNDEQQNITYLNPAFINTFGYDQKDIPTLADWWPKAYPDEDYRQWVADTWQQRLEQAKQYDKPFEPLEIVIQCKDDSQRTVLAAAASLTNAFEGRHLVILYDITERKQTADDFLKTAAMLENVVNSTPDLIFVKDPELKTIFCNQSFASAVGKTRDEMCGKTDIENGWDPELVQGNPEKGIRGYIHDDLDALSGKEVHNSNDPAYVNGEIRIFDTHKLPLRDKDGNTIGVLGVARDITERKRSEDQLQQQQQLLKDIAANYPNSYVSIIDKDFTTGFTSGQAFKKAGLNPDDFVGLSIDQIFGDQTPIIKEHYLKAFNGEENSFELFINEQYQFYRCIPLHEDNAEINRILVVVEDITQRRLVEQNQKDIEQRLRLATETTGLGLWQWDLKSNVIHWDTQMFRIYGIEPTTDGLLDYDTWKKAVLAEDFDQQEKILNETVHNQGQSQRQFRIRRSNDNEIRIIQANETIRTNDKGEAEWMVGTNLDISERIQTEEQLRHSQKMDALGKLTGGIAHDFNNMLGVIMGYTELLQTLLSHTPKLQHYANAILTASNRANALTSKLLAFSRKQTSDASPTNINELLQRDQHMLEKTLTARIKLIINSTDELWPIFIDEEMLGDAILNMSINAMHAMPDGGTLSISTENVALNNTDTEHLSIEPGDYVCLTVSDSGTGMDKKTRDQIFEPFFTTKGEHGTGLGMSQVYGLVKQSRGDIRIYSEPAQGTTIVIYIPRYLTSAKLETVKETPLTESNAKATESILIVDDEPALLELGHEILSAQGYRVSCANSGKQALEVLNSKHIDLVLSDVIMPEMDGYQLATQIQQQYPHIKIQMVSGYNDDSYASSNNNLLHSNQLNKPYRSDELLSRIRDLLDKQ